MDFIEVDLEQKRSVSKLTMSVLNVRTELLAYYIRRGYMLTGETEAYPLAANVGESLLPLHLVLLEKSIQ